MEADPWALGKLSSRGMGDKRLYDLDQSIGVSFPPVHCADSVGRAAIRMELMPPLSAASTQLPMSTWSLSESALETPVGTQVFSTVTGPSHVRSPAKSSLPEPPLDSMHPSTPEKTDAPLQSPRTPIDCGDPSESKLTGHCALPMDISVSGPSSAAIARDLMQRHAWQGSAAVTSAAHPQVVRGAIHLPTKAYFQQRAASPLSTQTASIPEEEGIGSLLENLFFADPEEASLPGSSRLTSPPTSSPWHAPSGEPMSPMTPLAHAPVSLSSLPTPSPWSGSSGEPMAPALLQSVSVQSLFDDGWEQY